MQPRIRWPRATTPVLAALLLIGGGTGCAKQPPASSRSASSDSSGSDPSARVLADSVMAAMGGAEAWERARYLAFDFVVLRHDTLLTRRSLRWDRTTNDIRVASTTREGKAVIVRTNLDRRDGEVRVDGVAPDSADRAKRIADAYRVWVNDTYWLLMPYKLEDRGVRLRDAGVDSTGSERVLHLSFDHVGLTPGDQYWVHVDPASGLVTGWEMLLEGDSAGVKSPVTWTEWREIGGIQLARRRVFHDDPIEIRFENLTVSARPPAGAFEE